MATQISSIVNKVTKCLEGINDVNIPKGLTEKQLKDRRSRDALNKYIGMKDDLKECLDFLHLQFQAVSVSCTSKSQTQELGNKIQLADNAQSLPDNYSDEKVSLSSANKICNAQTVRKQPVFTPSTVEEMENLIKNRLQVIGLKERLQRDTKLVLIEELVHPVKTQLKNEFKEKDLIDVLVQRNADLVDRLAAEMNARISEDERDLENINIRNRPMNVAEEYNLLMSNAWLEAKCSLDKISGLKEKEAEKYQFLCEIITEAYTQAQRGYECAMKQLGTHLRKPMSYEFESLLFQVSTKEGKKAAASMKCTTLDLATGCLPNNVLICIVDYLRARADYVKLDDLCQEIKKACVLKLDTRNEVIERLFENDAVQQFVKECARLAWKMVIQRPPMIFGDMGLVDKTWKGNDQVDLVWGSSPKQGAVVKYYKHPVLIHGDKVMAKGAIFVE